MNSPTLQPIFAFRRARDAIDDLSRLDVSDAPMWGVLRVAANAARRRESGVIRYRL